MNKVEIKHMQKNNILKVDLTNVKIDNNGRVVVNDPIINNKIKSIQIQASSVPTLGPSDKLCPDTKLCLDVTCPPLHNNLCGCMPNVVGCACPPLPKPNHGCIPLGEKGRKDNAKK